MNDLICELVKEDDPFLREAPEAFNFENPQVDPEKLVDVPWMQHEVEAITAHAKASPPANQKEPVLIPGEPELISLNERLAKGIPLDDASWEQILAVGEALGLTHKTMHNLV